MYTCLIDPHRGIWSHSWRQQQRRKHFLQGNRLWLDPDKGLYCWPPLLWLKISVFPVEIPAQETEGKIKVLVENTVLQPLMVYNHCSWSEWPEFSGKLVYFDTGLVCSTVTCKLKYSIVMLSCKLKYYTEMGLNLLAFIVVCETSHLVMAISVWRIFSLTDICGQ